jgi:hypothetical protein
MECEKNGDAYDVEGWVVAVDVADRKAILSEEHAPQDTNVPSTTAYNIRVTHAPHDLKLGERARLRVVYDKVWFQGDPCCTPGPYEVHPP